ncbi:MAG TPA: acylphosphatase [Casimicrobiaceae bacterium]|nr:acylphosphatase [Casimicrobiaceae bacterium]
MTDELTDPRPAPDLPNDPLVERRIGGEQVYRGVLLDARRDRVQLPDGGKTVREYIVHPGAVLMIPLRDDGRMIVERQFRYPHNRSFVEFPAGKLDPGEGALDTAVRELIEETGHTAQVWTRLGMIHPVISYSTEAIEIYEARGLSHVGAKLDPGEFLELDVRSEAELYEALDNERLTDAKTIAALVMHSRWSRAQARSVRLRIRGQVQGVGFRDWAIRTASAQHIRGWVRNRGDGSVEAHLQGTRDACDRFVDACRAGPRACRVERIDVERAPFDDTLSEFGLMRSR